MKWMVIYNILLVIALLTVALAFLFPVSLFIPVASIGAVLGIFAFIERLLIKKEEEKIIIPESTRNVAHVMSFSQEQLKTEAIKDGRKSFFGGFFKKKENISKEAPKLEPSQEEPKIEDTKQPEILKKLEKPKEDIKILLQTDIPKDENEKIKMMMDYLKESIKRGFPKDKIKNSAIEARWPEELFEKAYMTIENKQSKSKLIIFTSLLVIVFGVIIALSKYGLFVIPYWIKSLRNASPLFYIGASFVLLAIILIFSFKLKKTVKAKKIEYVIKEEKKVEGIKQSLKKFEGSYQTDLDKLYAILTEKGKLTMMEVAKGFNISKAQAEEWGKILKDQDLINLHYPTVGETELIWKKLKST